MNTKLSKVRLVVHDTVHIQGNLSTGGYKTFDWAAGCRQLI